jgi:hypothetical protein
MSDQHSENAPQPSPPKQAEQNTVKALTALRYHKEVCAYFEQHEKKVWNWFSDLNVLEKSFADTRDALLKNTYRLTSESHPKIYEQCQLAMQRLGIDAPATLYQANDGAMNAALFYVPKEVHIVFYGPLLEKLSEGELLALLGHELSHYLLWSMDNSRYLIAQQVLEDSVAKAPQNNSLYETARIYALNTETFADRGSVLVAQDEKLSIAVLLKVMTGLRNVDSSAFLEQAQELDAKGEISNALSHPELYLRALLMQKWQTDETQLDEWMDAKLKGPIDIHSLDLLSQANLRNLTVEFFHYMLDESTFASEMVINEIKGFFPKWLDPGKNKSFGGFFEAKENTVVDVHMTAKTESKKTAGPEGREDIDEFITKLNRLNVTDSTKDYFIALLFDIAFADRDQSDEVLMAGSKVMAKLKWHKRYKGNLQSILKLPKLKIDKLVTKAGAEVAE